MDLDDQRRAIDELDRKIVELLNERAKISLAIGQAKAAAGAAVFAPEREQLVYERILAQNQGPLGGDALRDIYGAIIASSRTLQQPLRIAYLGPAGTFTHEVAHRQFGPTASYLPARTIAEIFAMTEKGQADHGVVPVENTTEGVVTHTLDMFVDSELKICAELSLVVSQNLLSKSALAEIRRVYSHPQAIAQCRGWLASNIPEAELVDVSSTSRAAEMAAGEPGTAAISTATAARLYGLNIIAPRIEDNTSNITRFFVIGRTMSQRSAQAATSVLFSIRDRVGALHDVLNIFLHHGINLTRIESRPSKRRAWDYLFFVDVVGHPDDENVSAALKELGHECVLVKVLGAWPRD